MNYGDYAYIEAFPEGRRHNFPPTHVGRNRQCFEVWIRTLPNEQAHFALRAALREVERLVETGLTAEQFELTRAFLEKYVLHFADTTTLRLGYAVDDRFYGLSGEGHLARFRRLMREITRDEVNAAIRKHLQVDDVKIAIVTGQAEVLARTLAADAPSPISYPTEKDAAILTEDEAIASYPLGIEAKSIRIVPLAEMFER
jgi:zinc protease